jgi:DNA-directed RNA polymerase sigma subunit (sigma70/sigma32)
MEYLSDRLAEPEDFYEVFPWDTLTTKSQNTLQRAIERSDVWRTSELNGFSFDLLSKISIEDLNDARFIGPARAEELLQELVIVFQSYASKSELDSSLNIASKIISTNSLDILAKLTVDNDLNAYLRRIGSVELLADYQRDALLEELLPVKNPLKRIMLRKRDKDVPLGLLIDANLRLSFTLAKRVCVNQDIRARTIAGNLGLLAGINSFSAASDTYFERHIMKYIREFIEDLVGVSALTYDDIVKMMLGSNTQNDSVSEDRKVSNSSAPFKICANFDELYEELDRELLKLPKVDQRALAILKHRHQAFDEPGLTLDEIGRTWGVTRERVRQIVDPLMDVKLSIESAIPILTRAIELFETCEDDGQFETLVLENEIFSGREITWERLWGISRILSQVSLAERIYERNQEQDIDSEANSSIRSLVKKDRSKFGLYDLHVVSKRYEIDADRAFKIISEIYPRSIRSGNLVLARTKNLDSMFENSIAKQLKVSSPLDVIVLSKGLQRTAKNRDVALLGTVTELANLIFDLAGNPPTYERMSVGLIKKIEFQTLENWLIEIFSEANLGILHSNDVVNFALRDGSINVSSVTVYLLNSPIIRSHGKSIFSLVGTEVSSQQLEDYSQIIKGTSEASEVSYEMSDASKGILSVKPNLNAITSGIVFPPSGYKQLFEGFKFESSCQCGGLETIQAVKFAPSGFWTGFTAMIRHGFSQHQMSKGSTFRFEFDFDSSEVRLLVN